MVQKIEPHNILKSIQNFENQSTFGMSRYESLIET